MKLSCWVFGLVTIFATVAEGHSESRERIRYLSRVEDPVIQTQSGKIHHLSHFTVTFSLHNKEQYFRLDLAPNHDVLAEDASVQYLDVHGNVKHSAPIARHEHKVFKGTAQVREDGGEWVEAGSASIYVERDGKKPLMEGTFNVFGDHHHIQKRSSYFQTRREIDVEIEAGEVDSMIVYRDSDMAPQEQGHHELKRDEPGKPTCGSDDLKFNADPDHSIFRARSADTTSWGSMLLKPNKRQSGNIGTGNLRATIGDTTGCPTELRVAMIGIATDCTYTNAFSTTAAVQANLVSVVNSASSVYERAFNIRIGLRNLTISDRECPATAPDSARWNIPCTGGTIEDRLDLFSRWRGGLSGGSDGNAYWTLMSTCASGRSVGLAWLGQLCVSSLTGYGGQSVSGANVVVRTPGEWQVFAHESAHTFGAVHDCDSATCEASGTSRCCPVSADGCNAEGQFLMSPVSGTGLSLFSPCSIGNICSGLGRSRVRSSCLTENRNIPTINGAQCGNGIVEAGEDCDCGSAEECGNNPCCNPTTCKFAGSAVCDDANDACCSSCQFRPAGTVCRPGKSECDRAETCTGSSGICPTDSFFPNGQSCGNSSGLACATGQCTSRNLQCQSINNPMNSQNFTSACDSTSCSLTCSTDSNQNSFRSVCAALDQNFVDGTPCSSNGVCSNGRCRSESDVNNNNSGSGGSGGAGGGGSWFDNNRSLVIGLAAGLGGLLVLLLACCFISSCRSRRRKKKLAAMPPPPIMGQYYSNPHPAYPGPAHLNQYPTRGSAPLVRYA